MVHLLNADRDHIEALRGEQPGPPPDSRPTPAEFANEWAQIDDRLVACCEGLTALDLSCQIQIR